MAEPNHTSKKNAEGTKICSIINKYALEELNQQLCDRHASGDSLRGLADFVNKRILKAAIDQADAYLVAETDSIYKIFTDDDISSGRRTEMESKLENEGVDVETVRDDFVSHQTVKKHLNQELNVDTSRKTDFDQTDARSRIEWSKSRHEAVIENTLSQLQAVDEIPDTDFMVFSSVHVTCEECDDTFTVHGFIENGGCDCSEQPSTLFRE